MIEYRYIFRNCSGILLLFSTRSLWKNMENIEMPAKRPISNSIVRSFLFSNKKHLIITGTRHCGKSTLFHEIVQLLTGNDTLCGFTTRAIPKKQVLLTNTATGEETVIGIINPNIPPVENAMDPIMNGFLTVGIDSVHQALKNDFSWAGIDEIGYLESSCRPFHQAVFQLFDAKRVIAVIRKQDTPFLNKIRQRNDIFLYDMDCPVMPVGCVIMASGMGRRFGSNKLAASFDGEPLITRILKSTDTPLFSRRVVVTRHREIEELCLEYGVDVLLHDLPGRNDTIRLGLNRLNKETGLSGCMFCSSDQPLLTRESIETLALTFSHTQRERTNDALILRLGCDGVPGNPVIFNKNLFKELCKLPAGAGGKYLIQKYQHLVHMVPVSDSLELADVDIPSDLCALTAQLPFPSAE
jgi:molybdenum cofactor cytidylyltransferase